MAIPSQLDYDAAIQAMAQRNESVRSSWRASRISPIQSSRRHSARIEKPRSHHPSPRTPERRRAVTSTKHYSAMEDHWRRMMGFDDEDEMDQNAVLAPQLSSSTRPVSWHPGSSTGYEVHPHAFTTEPSPTSQYLSYQNSPFNAGTAQLQAPQAVWSSYMHGDFIGAAGQHQASSLQSEPEPTSWYEHDSTEPGNRITSTWTEQEENESRDERESSVELVGLGLYDEPGFTVKIGSKLEEECDPPEFDEEDDEEEESEEEEELPKPEETKVTQSSLPLDMSGQSFFVGPDEGYKSNNWWTGVESKQPVSTVSSVNYGWI